MNNIVSIHDIPTNCLYGLYSDRYNGYYLMEYGSAEQGPASFAGPIYQHEANIWLADHEDERWAVHIFTEEEITKLIKELKKIRKDMRKRNESNS